MRIKVRQPSSGRARTRGTESIIDVPPFARPYRFDEVALSAWTRVVLERLGLTTLGNIHERTSAELCELRGVNLAVVDELVAIVAAVRRAGPELPIPARDMLDDALERLEPDLRQVLLLRHGGSGEAPLSLAQTALRCGLGTREWARQTELRAIAQLRRLAGPVFGQVLREMEVVRQPSERPWDKLLRRGDSRNVTAPPWDYAPFYVRLFGRLAPELHSNGDGC